MAEKSAPVLTKPRGSRDHEEMVGKNLEKEKDKKNDRSNPCGNEDRPMNDKLEKGKMMKDQSVDDISSDEDEIPLENENTLLTRHKEQLKQAREGGPIGLPSEDTTAAPPNLNLKGQVSYANTAAQATVTKVVVGSSGARILGIKLKSRPRSVIVHGPESNINPTALCKKLVDSQIVPRQVQVMQNKDIEITFTDLEDKNKFFELDFVEFPQELYRPRGRFLAGYQPPVWVRVHYKPAEMKTEVITRRIQRYGRVLFARANKVPGTEILTGTLTFKMILHSPIPSYFQVGPYSLSVRYDGQSQTCRKCNEVGHMARECQVKRCFNCGDPGHLNVDCESERICQGCASPDHKLEKCPVSWEPEDGDDGSESMISDEGSDGGDGDEGSVGREGEDGRNDEATPAIQNQTEGVSHGLETSAAGQENRPEVDSPIPESLFNQCASDWGSLCETLAEKRLPNQDERLDIKNSGAVDCNTLKGTSLSELSDSLFSPVSYSSLVIDEGDATSPLKVSPALKRSLSDDNLSVMSSFRRPSVKKKVRDGI